MFKIVNIMLCVFYHNLKKCLMDLKKAFQRKVIIMANKNMKMMKLTSIRGYANYHHDEIQFHT